MGGHAINVAMVRCQCQQDGFLLKAREGARREQDGARDLRFCLDHSREQTLGSKDCRYEAEVLPKRLVRRERIWERRLRNEAHGSSLTLKSLNRATRPPGGGPSHRI